jgi:hypothetical protein
MESCASQTIRYSYLAGKAFVKFIENLIQRIKLLTECKCSTKPINSWRQLHRNKTTCFYQIAPVEMMDEHIMEKDSTKNERAGTLDSCRYRDETLYGVRHGGTAM